MAQTSQDPTAVWVTTLDLLTMLPLAWTFLRHGRFTLRFTAATPFGLVLAWLLASVGVLRGRARHTQFTFHGLRVDDSESPRLLVQGWLPNQIVELFFKANKERLAKYKYPDSRVSLDRVMINFRKAVAHATADVLVMLESARYWHKTEGINPRRIVIITPRATLAGNIPPEWIGEEVEFITPWSRHNSLIFRLVRSGVRCLTESFRRRATRPNSPPAIGVSAAWGIDPSARLNDLFWWWESDVPAERVVLFFDHPTCPASTEWVTQANNLGLRCVVLDRGAVGDSPHLQWRPSPGAAVCLGRFWRAFRTCARGVRSDSLGRWLARQTLDMMYGSERIEDFLVEFNLRGLSHYQDGGIDHLSLACDMAESARIGHHWSHFSWPEAACARLHQVYFAWGTHQVEILEASGSNVDHVLVSGCVVQSHDLEERGPFDPTGLRRLVTDHGATRVLTLFDTSVPCEDFYRFFLEKAIEDSRWGLLIKPKNENRLSWNRSTGSALGDLYHQAAATGRVRTLESKIPPPIAAAAADLAVAVDINSAAVVSALAGQRAAFMDYVRLHDSPFAQWAKFHNQEADRLVFDDNEKFWDRLNRFMDEPSTNPCLGVMDPVLRQEIDPFQDRMAGKRIGEYIRWYLKACDAGLGRDASLEQASQQYNASWGNTAMFQEISGKTEMPEKSGQPS